MIYGQKISGWFLITTLLVVLTFSGCRTKEALGPNEDFSGIELTYYKVYDDADVIQPMITAYEAEHPGLKINYRKFDDFSEYESVILNELAEGEGPDIFSMPNTWFASNYRKLTPLPASKGDVAAFESIFVDVAKNDLVRTDVDGIEQVFALPMTVDTLALFYNKDHYEDRIPARGRPASTWGELLNDVALLTKEDNSFERFEVAGIAMGRSDNITRAVDILYMLFLQYGVDFYNENISEAIFSEQQGGVASFPAAEALEFFVSFADPSQKHFSWNEFVASDDNDSQEIEAFAKGKVSMVIGYSFMYDDIMNQIDLLSSQGIGTISKDAVRIAEIPQIENPSTSTEKRVAYGSYFAETVSRTTDYPEIAWDFLIHMTSKENLDFYFDELHKPTSRRDMIADQRKDPIYGVFASQIGFAESFPIVNYFRYKEIFEEVISASNNRNSYQEFLRRAQDLIDNLLPEAGYVIPKAEVVEEE